MGRALKPNGSVRRRSAIGVCLLAAGILPACRTGDTPPVPSPVTLHIGVAIPSSNRAKSINTIATFLSAEPLVAVGWDGRPEPRLAADAQPLEEGPGFRVTLRPNVRYHNDDLVTAGSVARILSENIARGPLPGFENVASIEPDGENALVIRYRDHDAFILADLNIYDIADARDVKLRTGPFQVVDHAAEPVRLSAFGKYHRGRPAIDAIEIRAFDTPRSAWSAMMRGEINYLHEVSRDSVEFVEREAAVGTYPLLRPYYVVLVFNLRHPILGKREVRIALNEAVDRNVIVRDAMRGKGRPADGPIWPYHWAYSSAQRAHGYNPEAARLRLDSSGLMAKGANAPDRMASRFRFTCLVPSDDLRFERIALIVQRQLFDLGIDMVMEPVPVSALQVRAATGNYDAFLYEMTSGRTLSWVYRFWHSPLPPTPAFLRTGYSGADRALDRIRGARSDADTRSGVADLQRALFEDPPAIFLAWPQETRAIDRAFAVPYQRDADVVGTLWQAQLAAPQTQARR